MGLLDQVLGSVFGGSAQNSPVGGVVSSLLGGQGTDGNLQELIGRFEQGGLGHIIQSWTSSGANLPISVEQLRGLFTPDHLQQMASQAGLDVPALLSHLQQHLPTAVSAMANTAPAPTA